TSTTTSFQSGNNGDVMWASGCDWTGGDIANVQVSSANCGGSCLSNSACTHFTWTNYNGGTCWLKSSSAVGPVSSSSSGIVCGYVTEPVNAPSGLAFQSGNSGAVKWALACDWTGGDITGVTDLSANCGSDCLGQSGCTHFSWTNYNGGTCWLKNSDYTALVSSTATGA
ncbi:hypothetical protein HK100_010714, partial [Physocladia obscura]